MTGALTGLHIFKGEVVNLAAFGVRMPDVFEHLHTRRLDVDFIGAASERAHQAARLLWGSLASRKPGHRDRQDIFARLAETIHRARAYQQRMRRIDPARNSNHDVLDPGRAHPRGETLYLDIENFCASLVASGGIGRHVRKALVFSLWDHLAAPRQL